MAVAESSCMHAELDAPFDAMHALRTFANAFSREFALCHRGNDAGRPACSRCSRDFAAVAAARMMPICCSSPSLLSALPSQETGHRRSSNLSLPLHYNTCTAPHCKTRSQHRSHYSAALLDVPVEPADPPRATRYNTESL